MLVKLIKDEGFSDYKKPYMFIGTPFCSFKCCIEANIPISVCQNSSWAQSISIFCSNEEIIKRYRKNPITEAIVFGGLEPLDSWEDLLSFIRVFREKSEDDIVIYTGYNEYEVTDKIRELSNFSNIIIKFGRFIPDQEPKFDEVLGITLASPNQYGKKIS